MIDQYERIDTGHLFVDENKPKLEYLVINTIGDFPANISNHVNCEINICFDGEGMFVCDGQKVKVNRGGLMIVNPYANHATSSKTQGSFYILGFSNVSFDIADKDVLITQTDIKHIEAVILLIKDIIQNKLYEDTNVLSNLVSAILNIATSLTKAERLPTYISKGTSLTAKVANYLEKNYHAEIEIDDLCKMFYCSKSTLIHSFKEQYGISVMNYLKERRLKEIKFWLRISDKPVTEIAYENGFKTLPYFFKYFQRKEGMTPQKYRKINRE